MQLTHSFTQNDYLGNPQSDLLFKVEFDKKEREVINIISIHAIDIATNHFTDITQIMVEQLGWDTKIDDLPWDEELANYEPSAENDECAIEPAPRFNILTVFDGFWVK